MITLDEVRTRVKTVIVDTLELEIEPDSIANDCSLFDKQVNGGLELDSLAALEIIVAFSQEFNFIASEVAPEAFINIDTLSRYVLSELQNELSNTEPV